jgi:metal-sulfur cluster biosynthetic enzyme
MIVEQVRAAVTSIVPSDTSIDVELVWDPPWTPDKMSGIAKEHFGWSF